MIPKQLIDNCISYEPVGSRVTCNPPPTDTDQDYLVLVTDEQQHYWLCNATDLGFWLDNESEHYEPSEASFNSWRNEDNINLIITRNCEWHERFLLATKIAKRFNLMKKEHRKRLFQAILYAKDYDEVKDIPKSETHFIEES